MFRSRMLIHCMIAALLAVLVAAPLTASAAPAETYVAGRCGNVYIVRSGDTLNRIAQAYGTTAAAIMRTNGIANADRIYAGQRLCLSTGTAGYAGPGNGYAGSAAGWYRVRQGDTLAGVAWRYGVNTRYLQWLNGLANPNYIYAGQLLRVQN